MKSASVIFVLVCGVNIVFSQGSGNDGNLRLCIVEGRGSYKRAARHCPTLDQEDSKVECVLGTDRLDCLRRISKGTVDFGVFSPEDLVAAQWARVDVLVTNELRSKPKPFERSVVAVANRRILQDGVTTLHAVIQNATLCHPGVGMDDIRPMSDTLSGYLESLVLERACDPKLSLTENRIKALAQFFGKACKAGPWVPDQWRDAELKRRYSSLCAACAGRCDTNDPYWGNQGALTCLAEKGDITWAELEDVRTYFGLTQREGHASADRFAYVCRDGSFMDLDGSEPCVWLHRPWPIIVAKRKSAVAVAALASSLRDGSVLVDRHWRGALAALLEIHLGLPDPLQPPLTPMDYLAKAKGFREAYSQSGCDPPRHITLCTTTILEKNKCEWLNEAGSVYGIAPPLQCSYGADTQACLQAVQDGRSDVVVTSSEYLVAAMRDYSVAPILHEATPIVEKASTVVAVVRADAAITDTSSLKGKRASFPTYDGVAWHSALRYFMTKDNITCSDMGHYFTEICAPGIENYNVTRNVVKQFTKNCYVDDGNILSGEIQALRAVVEGKSDVAFISMGTYNMYTAQQINEDWASSREKLVPVCPEENKKYCFISWSNIGHILAPRNLTAMRRQEIINVFTKLDQLFGKHYPFHNAMFSMYGQFSFKLNILFHNNTKMLATDDMLNTHPYDNIPLNLERSLRNSNMNSCHSSDFLGNFGANLNPSILLLVVSLVFFVLRI
ncbi:transferrin-like [Achroia grisella]|uniref:transferrin-like n=1 Tax=Achroia grisella TaxID=688607 RepID=UPI0027D21A06|nr:transferrin-like [Achroia grisella]